MQSVDLGLTPYRAPPARRRAPRAPRPADRTDDTGRVWAPPPVYTRGRRSEPGELPFGEQWYAERGIEIVDVDRGGKITYHGPGQLVLYPICRVTDVKDFVCKLEKAMVHALAAEGIDARGRSVEGIEFTGAWVEDRKIGSIGLHVSHGVTSHGLSLNVNCDLEPFSWIVPCGLPDSKVTSVAQELGSDDPGLLARVRQSLLAALSEQ